jgi:hypothetical protein
MLHRAPGAIADFQIPQKAESEKAAARIRLVMACGILNSALAKGARQYSRPIPGDRVQMDVLTPRF